MNDLPDRIELPAPRYKLAALLAMMLVIIAVGVFTALKASYVGWIVAGAGIILAGVYGYALANGVGLSLDRDGFTARTLLGERRHAWSDCSEFKIGRRGKIRALRFDDAKREGGIADVDAQAGRGNSSISPILMTNGLKRTRDLMNAFRARALRK